MLFDLFLFLMLVDLILGISDFGVNLILSDLNVVYVI